MKEYLETVKDFDELVSPQSLFLHFLGLEPSNKVWKNLVVVKKSECSIFFLFFYFFYFYNFSFVLGMTTKFSKQKLVEAQEKKAKNGLVRGLLSRKRLKAGDVSKDDHVVTSPSAHSLAKHPASPTSSLEVITFVGEEAKKKKKKKIANKSFLPTF